MNTGNSFLFVVADGPGGHPSGDIASAIAVSAFEEREERSIWDSKEFLLDALAEAQIAVLKSGQQNPELLGMGDNAPCSLGESSDGTDLFMNVGDSRGRHLINGGIMHTQDQNMAQALVRSGRLTEEEAMNHPLSKVLNQALGDIEPPVVDFYSIDVKGNYLILSSDGLHGFVRKERMWEIVIDEGHSLSRKVQSLIDEALRCGSDYNITVILAGEE